MKENKKQKLDLEGLDTEGANVWINGKHVKGKDPDKLDKLFYETFKDDNYEPYDPRNILELYIKKDERLVSEVHKNFHQRYGEAGQHYLNLKNKERPVHIHIKEEYGKIFLAYLEGWIDCKKEFVNSKKS